jgi:hypothetical protein
LRERRRAGRGALFGVALASACALVVERPAGAQGAVTTTEDVAEVVIAGSDAESSGLLDTVRGPLGDMGLRVQATRATERAGGPESFAAGARARVWIDARAVDRVDVVVSVPSAGGTRSVARTVSRGDSPSIVVEEVAYVVRATLESLLSEPAPPPQPLPPVVAQPPPVLAPAPTVDRPLPAAPRPGRRDRFALDAVAFATGRALGASTAIGAGGGLDAAPWGRAPGRPTLWLTGAFNAPFETPSSLVTLQTDIVSVRALADVELTRVGALRVAAGGGGGMDVFHAVPLQAGSPSVTLGATTTRIDPLLAARVQALVHVAGGPSFVFALDLDYDVEPHRYEALQADGARSVVLDPWRFRPGGEVGLSVPLFGGASGE